MSKLWVWLYDIAMLEADAGTPTLYYSRIDGCLLPMEGMAL